MTAPSPITIRPFASIRNRVYAYVGRGEAYDSKGDYDRAIADYDQAIRLDPKYAPPITTAASPITNKGDYDRAIADYDQAIRLDPKLANAHDHRGWAYYKKGDIGRATADVNEAVRLNPKYASARERRGYILLASGDAKSALDDFNEALRLKAESIGALSGRGQVYEQQGLRSLALADYKKAIELKAVGTDETEAQNKARARAIVLESPATPGPAQTGSVAQKPKPPVGRRVALVIGNGAYKAVGELGNPKNDAAAVAGELTRLGFEVIEKHDLGVAAMRKVLGEFEDKAAGAEWAFVYYAGPWHGAERPQLAHPGRCGACPRHATRRTRPFRWSACSTASRLRASCALWCSMPAATIRLFRGW